MKTTAQQKQFNQMNSRRNKKERQRDGRKAWRTREKRRKNREQLAEQQKRDIIVLCEFEALTLPTL
jgi:hypothetical protein